MAGPKDVLSPDDYSNYRNVRAISILFVVMGSVLVLGASLVLDDKSSKQMHPVIAGLGIAGLAGVIGGIAALRGNRRWAPLVYGMVALYVFGFPIGTILSMVMFKGLSRYLESVERIRRTRLDRPNHPLRQTGPPNRTFPDS